MAELWNKYKSVIAYLFWGVVTTVVNIGVFQWLSSGIHWNYQLANIIVCFRSGRLFNEQGLGLWLALYHGPRFYRGVHQVLLLSCLNAFDRYRLYVRWGHAIGL